MKRVSADHYQIKNLRSEWDELHEVCLNERTNGLTIVVDMRADGREDEMCRDAMNLRHMIPLAISLYRAGIVEEKHPLKVRIEVAGNPGWGSSDEILEEDDAKRAFVFLLGTKGISFVKVYINGQFLFDINGNKQVRKIFPLYLVCNEGDNAFVECYKFLRRPLNTYAHGDKDVFSFHWIVNEMLMHIGSENLYRGVRGSEIPKITNEDKKRLRESVIDEIDRWRESMDVLSLSIWLILIRRMLDDRSIFLSMDGSVLVNDNLLSRSRLNAVSYGEAMYQLIENACEHSGGQMACFGFRIHEAGLNEKGDTRKKERRSREYLEERFGRCENEYQIFTDDGRVYFEFYVMDSIFGGLGMIEKFNKDHQNGWSPVEDIRSLFSIQPRDEREKYIEDLTMHYGLRLLRKIVRVNQGHLLCSTSHLGRRNCYYCDSDETTEKSLTYETEWDVLMPLFDQPQEPKNWPSNEIDMPIFGKFFHKEISHIQKLRMTELTDEVLLKNKKHADLAKYQSILWKEMIENDRENTLFVLEPEKDLYRLELFAKSVFFVVAKSNYKNDYPRDFFLAIIFPEIDLAYEFVRMYSVIYFDGAQEAMKNVQIAICSKHSDGTSEISMILGGRYLKTSLNIAHFYMYHYLSRSLQYLPIVEYLIDDGRENQETATVGVEQLSICPFDLFLTEEMFDNKTGGYSTDIAGHDSLFLSRIQRSLEKNIWGDEFGCKIEGVHVRHGSKLHTDTFYEAELLFHDPGNVFYLAYIVANDLLYGESALKRDEAVVLLGYERYSSSLMYQLEDCLRHFDKKIDIVTCIVYDGGRNSARGDKVAIHPLGDWHYEILSGRQVRVISVMPVGTTMSTIYKMHNAFSAKVTSYNTNAKKKIDIVEYSKNYCLILVANDEPASTEPKNRFYQSVDKENMIIKLQDEIGGIENVHVRYYLRVDAQWFTPEKCPLCQLREKEVSPIIDVKQAGLFPGAIFLKDGKRTGTFHDLFGTGTDSRKKNELLEINRERMQGLFSHIVYAHIYKSDHHFQFFIRFREFYRINRGRVQQALKGIDIVENAFHVVISPLEIQNAEFVQDVINQVFCGCAHFLHFNISDAYREEVRSKFSYITQEFIAARKFHPTLRFCIHYVDNSIMSGILISRAKSFAQMLLTQSHISSEDVYLFDRIFLLVNRSSYDTLHTFIRKPEKNLWAYIKLAIPCYNTETENCPACDNVDRYSRLEKRSSSEELSCEFSRLVQKHQKYSYDDYVDVIGNELLDNPVYFGLLRQWAAVYFPMKDNVYGILDKEILLYYQNLGTKMAEDRKRRDLDTAEKLHETVERYCDMIWAEYRSENINKQDFLKRLCKTSVREILSYDSDYTKETERNVIAFMRIYILGVRDYMRVYSLQRAYEQLDNIEHNDLGIERSIVGMLTEKVQALLNKNGHLIIGEQNKRIRAVTNNAEWLISYIKVISRAHVADFYAVRKVIVNVMFTMFLWIQMDSEELQKKRTELLPKEENWRKLLDTIIVLRGMAFGTQRKIRSEGNDTSALTDEGYLLEEREKQIYALERYQLYSLLFHRLANLQVRGIEEAQYINGFERLYTEGTEAMFSGIECPIVNYPDRQMALNRFVRSVKIATMTSNDDTPCMDLIAVSRLDTICSEAGGDTVDSLKLQIGRMLFLENTRMLYSGMSDLEKMIQRSDFYQTMHYRPAEKYGESVSFLWENVNQILTDCYNRGDIRYQNILGNFCKFWEKSFQQSVVVDDAKRSITYMLRLYQDLKLLSDRKDSCTADEIPYIYEDICRTICGISKYKMCYIVLEDIGQIPVKLMSSGDYCPYLLSDNILNVDDYKRVIHAFMDKATRILPSNVRIISRKSKSDESFEEKLFVIRFADNLNREEVRHFYIILQDNDRYESDIEQLVFTRNILSMRQSMVEVLHRDCADLVAKRYDCTYIRSRREKDDSSESSMIHISDLHIDSDYQWKKEKYLEAMRKVRQIKEDKHIDLLMISGDLVDGRQGSAPVMTERYHYAKDFLNNLVIELWHDDDEYLPHDWKRRIIISTGNHDYASMNQYRSYMESRDLGPGLPIDTESGTMSKFAYFIDFLRDYLDAPVFDWLQNDLNEVRDYRNLNIKLLVLNCSSKATPRRTNKMGFDWEKVKLLLQAPCWKENSDNITGNLKGRKPAVRICLAHYSPEYKLSYFLDKFVRQIPGWEWGNPEEPMNQLVEKYFAEAVEAEACCRYCAGNEELREHTKKILDLDKKREDFKRQWKGLEDALKDFTSGITRSSKDDFSDPYFEVFRKKYDKDRASLNEKMRKNPLYKDMETYVSWLEKGMKQKSMDENDEIVNHIFKQIADNLQMGRADRETFTRSIDDVDREGGRIQLYLVGHIHAYKKEAVDSNPLKKVLVVGRAFDGNLETEEMAGYWISLNYEKGEDRKTQLVIKEERFDSKK